MEAHDGASLAQAMTQHRVLELEEAMLSGLLEQQPHVTPLTFGSGQEAEQTVPGDPRAPWHGLALLNPTPFTIYGGDGPSGALQPTTIVPPYSWVCVPVQFVDYSLGIRPVDYTGSAQTVLLVRLRHPPAGARAGRFGIALPLGESIGVADSVSPAVAGGTVVTTPPLAAGVYSVKGSTSVSASGHSANMVLRHGRTDVLQLANSMTNDQVWPFEAERVTVLEGETLAIVTVANDAGARYLAHLAATRIG